MKVMPKIYLMLFNKEMYLSGLIIMKIFLKLLSWTAMIFFVSAAVGFIGLRVCSYTPYAVVSGSMEPTYKTGSLVFVKSTPAQSIKTGDAISFVLDEKLTVATHRVIKISDDGEYFYTKGDANQSPDANPVYYKNVIGKATFSIPFMGYFAVWAGSLSGKLFFGAVIFAVLAFTLIQKIRSKTSSEKVSAVNAET